MLFGINYSYNVYQIVDVCSVLQPLNIFPLFFLAGLHPDLVFFLPLTGSFSVREFEQGQLINLQTSDSKLLVQQTSKQAVVILTSQFIQSLSKVP